MKLILGTVQFGKDYGISNTNGKIPVGQIDKILRYAYMKGVNTLDTAFNYGESEKCIVEYLRKNPDQEWEVISKGPYANSDSDFEKYFIQSKSTLQDSLLVYVAHDANQFISNKAIRNKFYRLRELGQVKKIGVSVYSKQEILDLLDLGNIDVIQLPLNVLDHRLIKPNMLQEIKRQGIEIHVRSVFLQGLLFLSEEKLKNLFPDLIEPINILKEIASGFSLKMDELALAFIDSIPEIDRIVVGIDNIEQLKSNINSIGKAFNKDIYNEIISRINYNNENVLNPILWEKIKS